MTQKHSNNSVKIFREGNKVKGRYYEQPYTGVVFYARPHTMNDSFMHFINLDMPIEVFGNERNSIVVQTHSENTIEANE